MKYQEPVFNYEKAEKDLLDFIYPYSGYIPTYKYCYYDAIHPTKKHILEVKVRKFGLDYFNNRFQGQLIIEVDKYTKLQYTAQKTGCKLIYAFGFINYKTKEIEAYKALNLTNIDLSSLPIQEVFCPESTQWCNDVYKLKKCYIIPNGFIPESNIHIRTK